MTKTKVVDWKRDSGNFTHLRVAPLPGPKHKPGQYLTLSFGETDKPKFLAIASHISEQHLLFITRIEGSIPDHVFISEAMGNGFGCDFTDVKPFLFLGHGTAISALRPAVLERRQMGFSDDAILFGVASKKDEPDVDILNKDSGLTQLRAYSQEKNQRVQDLLAGIDLSVFGTVILIGSKEMMAACRQVLGAKNLPAERIFSNY